MMSLLYEKHFSNRSLISNTSSNLPMKFKSIFWKKKKILKKHKQSKMRFLEQAKCNGIKNELTLKDNKLYKKS